LLVALAISAALLTSVAVAVDASFKAYAINQNQAQLMQRARLALNRMVCYIRSTKTHLPVNDGPTDSFLHNHITTDTGIEMLLDSTHGVAFQQTGDHLEMVPFTENAGGRVYGTAHVLLQGVAPGDFRVTMEPQYSAQARKVGSLICDQLKRASIVLTVRPNDKTTTAGETATETVTLSASVMPRQNIW
jgi:hypothetical protein